METDIKRVLLIVFAVIAFAVVCIFGLVFGFVMTLNHFDKPEVERCYHQGFQAGKIGQPPEACPPQGTERRRSWLQGWLDGDIERRAEVR